MSVQKSSSHARSWETPYLANLERTADTMRTLLAGMIAQQRLGGYGVDRQMAQAVKEYDRVRQFRLDSDCPF